MKKIIALPVMVIVVTIVAFVATHYYPEASKDFLHIFGLFSAFLFFCYKLMSGWLVINMNVSVTLDRQRGSNHSDDHLVTKITLEKGKNDAARLLRMELRLSPIDAVESPTIIQDVTTHRLLSKEDGSIAWDTMNCDNKSLNLPPDERLEFAEYFRIPSGVAYRVELIVIGDRYRLRAIHTIPRFIPSISQWRATAISLPLEQVNAQT